MTRFTVQNARSVIMPPLHLTTVRNTIVSCTTCRATRMVSIKHYDGSAEIRKCPACKGTGQTYISMEGLSHR